MSWRTFQTSKFAIKQYEGVPEILTSDPIDLIDKIDNLPKKD